MRKQWALAGIVVGLILPVAAQALEAKATLAWARRVVLSVPVSGTVSQVLVDAGERVNKGQVLVRLDPRGFKAAVAERKAQLQSLSEARDEAKRELDRSHELYKRTVLSDHDLTLAKIDYAKADASYRKAQAALTQAKLDLEYSAVRAPFDGIVISRRIDVGQTVVSQIKPEPLVVMAEAGRMLARAPVAQADLAGLHEGQDVTVRLGGKSFKGTVRHIGLEPIAGPKQGLYYPVEVEFETGREVLRAGLPATVSLP